MLEQLKTDLQAYKNTKNGRMKVKENESPKEKAIILMILERDNVLSKKTILHPG